MQSVQNVLLRRDCENSGFVATRGTLSVAALESFGFRNSTGDNARFKTGVAANAVADLVSINF